MHYLKTALTALVVGATVSQAAVSKVTRQGKYLYDATGARFFIKGVAYQRPGNVAKATVANNANGGFPEPSDYLDPLTDITACNRDIPNFTALGINTIRVYSINPYGDHSACMAALNTAGIYVIADLSLPLNGSINRASPSWDTGLLDQYLISINNLMPYQNLLAFNVGNEVVTSTANSGAAPYVKAAARDIKAYLRAKGSSALVGYSSADGSTWRDELAAFLVCGSDDISIDLYGLNNYEWCGNSNYVASGYAALTAAFANFPIPAFFGEFGCITQTRTWTEVAAIYSPNMTAVWSGGIAFEYFADSLGYGLTANTTSIDGPITTNNQFTLLAAQYAAAKPAAATRATAISPAYVACAPQDANLIASSMLPGTPNDAVCKCLTSTAFPCVTRPTIKPVVVGALLDYACSLYATQGGSCNPISGNGTTGVYGAFSGCSSAEKLSYVATQYYEQQGQNAQACSYSGNLTINANAPTTSAGVTNAINACLAAVPSSGTFVPSLVPASPASTARATGAAAAASASGSAAPKAASGVRGAALEWTALIVAGALAVVV